MIPNRLNPQFTPDCTRPEMIFGWLYLCIHAVALPLLLPIAQEQLFPGWNAAQANGVYYAVSLTITAAFLWKLLRREFDHLCDRLWQCIKSLLFGYGLWYALSVLVVSFFTTMGWDTSSANDLAVDEMSHQGYNITLAMSVIAAPLVEELLFRGVVFQSLRGRSRFLAYAVSMLLFGLYHVWQFVYLTGDFRYLLQTLQYLPITFALTWAYETSGSLWVPIIFHASNNYIALMAMQYL